MRSYPTEILAAMKREKIENGPVVPILVSSVHANGLPDVTCKKFSNVESDYRGYCVVVDGDLSSDVPAHVVDKFDDILEQKTFFMTCGGFLFTTSDRSLIETALKRLPKTFQTSGSKLADIVRRV